MRRYATALIVLAACDVSDSPPPPPPFTYELRVVPAEPGDRAPSAAPPRVVIDGMETLDLNIEYASLELALASTHRIELRQGDVVVAAVDVVPEPNSCLDRVTSPDHLEKRYCGFDSGDLRFAVDEVSSPTQGCHADGTCIPRCLPGTCPGEKCTSRAPLLVPFSSHLACAPIGPRLLGETCSYLASEAGAYDDCAEGLLCVDGACRTLCRQFTAGQCDGCAYVPGHAPEIGICP